MLLALTLRANVVVAQIGEVTVFTLPYDRVAHVVVLFERESGGGAFWLINFIKNGFFFFSFQNKQKGTRKEEKKANLF